MKFLHGIKNCHACANRGKCEEKNDPATLCPPVKIDHMNRGVRRRGIPVVTIESCCRKFKPESKPFV